MPFRWREGAVDGFVRQVKDERFAVIGLNELKGARIEDIGDIAIGPGRLAIDIEHRVQVNPLAFETHPMVEPRARRIIHTHVPFADVRGFVTGVVQQPGEGNDPVAERGMVGVVDDAVGVGVLAGQETAPAGGTERDRNEEVFEVGAFFGDPIDGRRPGKRMSGASESVPPEIIHENENKIGPRRCRGAAVGRMEKKRSGNGQWPNDSLHGHRDFSGMILKAGGKIEGLVRDGPRFAGVQKMDTIQASERSNFDDFRDPKIHRFGTCAEP